MNAQISQNFIKNIEKANLMVKLLFNKLFTAVTRCRLDLYIVEIDNNEDLEIKEFLYTSFDSNSKDLNNLE